MTKVEIEAATLVDAQPVVKINFTTDKTMAFTDKDGNIVSGDGTPQVRYFVQRGWKYCNGREQKSRCNISNGVAIFTTRLHYFQYAKNKDIRVFIEHKINKV